MTSFYGREISLSAIATTLGLVLAAVGLAGPALRQHFSSWPVMTVLLLVVIWVFSVGAIGLRIAWAPVLVMGYVVPILAGLPQSLSLRRLPESPVFASFVVICVCSGISVLAGEGDCPWPISEFEPIGALECNQLLSGNFLIPAFLAYFLRDLVIWRLVSLWEPGDRAVPVIWLAWVIVISVCGTLVAHMEWGDFTVSIFRYAFTQDSGLTVLAGSMVGLVLVGAVLVEILRRRGELLAVLPNAETGENRNTSEPKG